MYVWCFLKSIGYRDRMQQLTTAASVRLEFRTISTTDVWIVTALPEFRSDLPALLDEWAGSLFRELDYRREAANGTRFKVWKCRPNCLVIHP